MRRALRIVLPIVALLLLAAHFYRAGLVPLAVASGAFVALVFIPLSRAARLLQVLLLVGTVEWLRTAWLLASHRVATGQPYGRMLVILGAVAALTLVAALLSGPEAAAARTKTS